MSRTPASRHDNQCTGVVREIGYLGGFSLFRVALQSGAVLRVSLPNAERSAATQFARDEQVFLSWTSGAGLVLVE
jgi:putrescine transport system ATP-binding protein